VCLLHLLHHLRSVTIIASLILIYQVAGITRNGVVRVKAWYQSKAFHPKQFVLQYHSLPRELAGMVDICSNAPSRRAFGFRGLSAEKALRE
jgi:hypothetical protein